jgi:hypothetical protein
MSCYQTIEGKEYLVYFKWLVKLDYTQQRKRSSGVKKPRTYTGVTTEVLSDTHIHAQENAIRWLKKKRRVTLDRITSATVIRVSFAYRREPPHEELPEDRWHLIIPPPNYTAKPVTDTYIITNVRFNPGKQ